MSFKKRVTKSIALALVGVTIAIPMLNTASAMENSKETYSQKIERVSKSFEDFVYLEDNQYKLDISVSELSESSKSDFYIYNDYINLLNNIIVSNNIKNVNQKCASCSCQAYYAHIFIVTHINVLSTDICAVYTILLLYYAKLLTFY